MKDYTGKLCEMLRARRAGHAQIREALRRSRPNARGQKGAVRRTTLMRRSGKSCPKPKSAVSSSAAKTGRRSRNCRWKATSSFSCASSPARTSVYWHDCRPRANQGEPRLHPPCAAPGDRSRRGWPAFTFTTCIFPARDHAAPGTGTVDFAALKPFVKPEHIKVFELSPSLPVEAVKCGITHVKAIWGNE